MGKVKVSKFIGQKPNTNRESMNGTPNLKNTSDYKGKPHSLERMCFDLIVQKFEQLYFALTKSSNVNLQRNFEFLQRRFSYQILTALYEKKNIKEEYLELFINEHLQFLNGEWLGNSLYINSAEGIFRRLPNLTRVSYRHCDDKILEYIAKFCPDIVEIDVRYSNVTDIGVLYLCEKNGMVPCPKLKTLFIEGSRVTDSGAEYLIRKLPLLEKIDYPKFYLLLHSIYNESLSNHQKMRSYNLVEIDLLTDENMYLFDNENMYLSQGENMYENMREYFCFYNEVLKTCLTVCRKLESIACFITDKEQLNFFNSSYLKKLTLFAWKTNSKLNIDNFIKTNGRNLTYLEINKCIISLSLLAENCPVLEELKVGAVNFTDENDDASISFSCLNKCSLSEIRPSHAKAFSSFLSFSPKLESLMIDSSILSLEMKKQILMWCLNSSAQQIKFHYIFLEMKFVRDILLSCRSLKAMNFVNCNFYPFESGGFLKSLAKKLPNKPCFYSRRHCAIGRYIVPENDGYGYLIRHPEEKYESSTFYDSLLHEIERDDYDSDEKDSDLASERYRNIEC